MITWIQTHIGEMQFALIALGVAPLSLGFNVGVFFGRKPQ